MRKGKKMLDKLLVAFRPVTLTLLAITLGSDLTSPIDKSVVIFDALVTVMWLLFVYVDKVTATGEYFRGKRDAFQETLEYLQSPEDKEKSVKVGDYK